MRIAGCAALLALGCGGDRGGESAAAGLSGTIAIDGSSTVFPITEAMAEEFGLSTGGGVRVNVATSGTGGGFTRFCTGETAISNASRVISERERQLCAQNSVDFAEIQVALDGLAVVVNPGNAFVQCLTVEELRRIWQPGSTVRQWSHVRPAWPPRTIKLYGPGTNSGTFDYFTEAVVGETGASRPDYTASEDDNVLVQGVEGDAEALGYFGFAYYQTNRDRLKLVAIDGGGGCVLPSDETVRGGTYTPLSRPLFIYVNRQALTRPEVDAFVRFYLEHAPELVPQVGYTPLEPAAYQAEQGKLHRGADAPRS
jgi:phosphate transport system substrate-binding protein